MFSFTEIYDYFSYAWRLNEAVAELGSNINRYKDQIKESKEIEKNNKQKTTDIEYKIKNAAEIKKKEQKVR